MEEATSKKLTKKNEGEKERTKKTIKPRHLKNPPHMQLKRAPQHAHQDYSDEEEPKKKKEHRNIQAPSTYETVKQYQENQHVLQKKVTMKMKKP